LNPSPFDAVAASYDASFTRTAVGTVLRAMVQERLAANFHGTQRVLELGCGTGEDALWLARTGVEVVATDASAEMIETASRKLLQENGRARVVFRSLAMENLTTLTDTPPFDGVFSNFGAINCVVDLPALIGEVACRLAPEARLVWVIMGRHVPWEWLWFLLRGEPAKALRRYTRHGVPWRGIRIAYPTPGQMAALLRPYFDLLRISPLGWALPPSYAAGWVERSPRVFAALTRLESMAHHSRVLAGLADHYILEARLRPAA